MGQYIDGSLKSAGRLRDSQPASAAAPHTPAAPAVHSGVLGRWPVPSATDPSGYQLTGSALPSS